jgi:class 3 adenylate cyclase
VGLLLNDAGISRRHLGLANRFGEVYVSDLGSTNGTSVGGRAVERDHRLAVGEVVRFGRCTLELVSPSVPGSRVPQAIDAPTTVIASLADSALSTGHLADTVRPATVAIVFSEIEGSARRALELGDERWQELLDVHHQIVRGMVARHGGTEGGAYSGGFVHCFGSARAAVACVTDVQRALAAHEHANPLAALRVRAGVHLAEAVVGHDRQRFDLAVIMAAKMADTARGGEIVVSHVVRELVEPRGDTSFGSTRRVRLDGSADEQLISVVRW